MIPIIALQLSLSPMVKPCLFVEAYDKLLIIWSMSCYLVSKISPSLSLINQLSPTVCAAYLSRISGQIFLKVDFYWNASHLRKLIQSHNNFSTLRCLIPFLIRRYPIQPHPGPLYLGWHFSLMIESMQSMQGYIQLVWLNRLIQQNNSWQLKCFDEIWIRCWNVIFVFVVFEIKL